VERLDPEAASRKTDPYVPTPRLAVEGVDGQNYNMVITNGKDFPDELFKPAPELPPVSGRANAARTIVMFHNVNGTLICTSDLASFGSLRQIGKFPVLAAKITAKQVYVVLHDRKLNRKYKSNVVTLPDIVAPKTQR
jgi:hypothetical protein